MSRLNLSFRYRLRISAVFTGTILFDIFNVTNKTNFSNQGSSFVTSGGFLIPTAARSPREFQLGIRFD